MYTSGTNTSSNKVDTDGLIGKAHLDQLKRTQEEITNRKERAGTMASVIVTILGIGIPILLQPTTKSYFHKLPFVYLLISFAFFYIVFLKYGGSLNFYEMHLNKRPVYKAEPLKKNLLTKILCWRIYYSKQPKLIEVKAITNRIESRSLGFSQWAHAFFLSGILLEIVEASIHYINTEKGKYIKFVLAIAILLLVRGWIALTPNYKFTVDVKQLNS